MQLLHGGDQRLHGGRIHEVKRQEVINPHGFQIEDSAGHIGAFDFWYARGQHLVTVGSLGVEAVAFTRTCAASSTGTLFSLSLF